MKKDNMLEFKIQSLYDSLKLTVKSAKAFDQSLVVDIVSGHANLMEEFFDFLKKEIDPIEQKRIDNAQMEYNSIVDAQREYNELKHR